MADDAPGVSAGGGQDPGGTMEVPMHTIFCREGRPPADDMFAYWGCPQPVPARSLCPVPDPRKRRGRRHALAGLLAVGIAAVIARGRGRSPRSGSGPPMPARRCWPGWARRAALRRSPPSGAPLPWSARMCSTRFSVPGHQPAAPGRPRQHRRRQPPPRPRPAADAKTASDRMSDFAVSLSAE